MVDMMPSPEAVRAQDKRTVAIEDVLVEILPNREVEIAALESHDELRVRMTKTERGFGLYELNIYPKVDSDRSLNSLPKTTPDFPSFYKECIEILHFVEVIPAFGAFRLPLPDL
ncbi:hypothetical protein NDI45_02105 [Leptolyngbya sp. GB1-A1]|uniref:hypothetical protein n=1 Tax=Leptolyngbya sp. GB1-A1 TaxID=2933908 RepID=UPI003297C375